MAGLDTQPSAMTLDLEELVSQAWQGRIRVPRFQRSFRWRQQDVIRLFDSIVKGYPIGSLLLWVRRAPEQTLRLGALRIEVSAMDSALWVVDGQQRITSLANALHKDGASDPMFALAYDLRGEKFVRRPAVEDPAVVPLPVLFDLHEILGWFARYPDATEYLDRATELTKTLRQFPVPAYRVVQDDERVLQDIFDRMNNYGKRLRRSEIFSALNAGEEAGQEGTLTFDLIAEQIDADLGFGVIDNDTVLKAVLARRGPDVMREIRNEFNDRDDIPDPENSERVVIEFPREDRDTAYQMGARALRKAVEFLQREAGIPHVSLVAYRYLIVVLTRVFAHHPDPDPRNLRLLRRWYWRAAVVGPQGFKGSTTGAVRALCTKVRPHALSDSVQGLLKLIDRPETPLPDLHRFRSNEASTKITLCAWWSAGPRSLVTGAPYESADLSNFLSDQQTAREAVCYIVPRLSVPEEYRQWAADRILLPDADADFDEADTLLTQASLHVDERTWEEVMRSHAITGGMIELLVAGKNIEFLRARHGLLKSRLDDFVQLMCEWGIEDTPPLEDLVIPEESDVGDETG